MFSSIASVIAILMAIKKYWPLIMAGVKAGEIGAVEVEKLFKWFFIHKNNGAKVLYVVPEAAVNKAVLVDPAAATHLAPAPVPTQVPAVPDDVKHIAETGGDLSALDQEILKKYGVNPDELR